MAVPEWTAGVRSRLLYFDAAVEQPGRFGVDFPGSLIGEVEAATAGLGCLEALPLSLLGLQLLALVLNPLGFNSSH